MAKSDSSNRYRRFIIRKQKFPGSPIILSNKHEIKFFFRDAQSANTRNELKEEKNYVRDSNKQNSAALDTIFFCL